MSPDQELMPDTQEKRARIAKNLSMIGNAIAANVRLVAVSKLKPAEDIRAAYAAGQRCFGENYVQEAVGKIHQLADLALEWHLIGPLQSNKCEQVALHFDWLQSLDREKLVPLLGKHRPADRAPLNVLIQVNIDDETSKSGCKPNQVSALAAIITAEPRLMLRGLMAIPAPESDFSKRAQSFAAMRMLFESLKSSYPQVDTLSMGMSDDFAMAIEHGATLIRVGSAIFGARG
jgi:PLP dependent protein